MTNHCCPICGEQFEPAHRNTKFCGEKCRREQNNRLHKIWREKPVNTEKRRQWNRRYCAGNRDHRREYQHRYDLAHPRAPIIARCIICGTEFVKTTRQLSCSNLCAKRRQAQSNRAWFLQNRQRSYANQKRYRDRKKEKDTMP